MNKQCILTAIIIMLAAFFCYAVTHVPSGDISGTWSEEGSPYYIEGDLRVSPSDTFIIEAGCSVIYSGNYGITVDTNAVFKAIGTLIDTIFFTGIDTVDGNGGLYFRNSSPICSLTYCNVQHGKYGFYAAAITTVNTDILISNSWIHDNGRAIYIRGNTPSFISNKISNNSSGFYIAESGAIIKNNEISFNEGYGIYQIGLYPGSCIIRSNIIKNNKTAIIIKWNIGALIDSNIIICNVYGGPDTEGGAINIYDGGSATIEDNFIAENYGHYGGAISLKERSVASLYRNVIRDNYASGNGGAVYCDSSEFHSYGNVIHGNSAGGIGGAIYVTNCRPRSYTTRIPIQIINTTISGNESPTGGGVAFDNKSSGIVMNSIIKNNNALSEGKDLSLFSSTLSDSTNVIITNSLITAEGIYIKTDYAKLLFLEGNIDCDPFFSDTLFHITDSSACINSGIETLIYNSYTYTAPDYDYDGDLRPYDGFIDIGADEFIGTYREINHPPGFVKIPEDFVFGNNGIVKLNFKATDPDFDSLNYIAITELAFEIIDDSVLQLNIEEEDTGTHTVKIVVCDSFLCDTCNFIVEIIKGTGIFGSLEGIWDSTGSPYILFCHSNVETDDTLIILPNVDVLFAGGLGITIDSNAVIKAIGDSTGLILFTSLDTLIRNKGVLFHHSASGCTLNYCLISHGTGIDCYYSEPVIENCIIEKNFSEMGGGGIKCSYSDAIIIGNTIKENESKDYGGGIYVFKSSPIIANNSITDNSVTGDNSYGGGIAISNPDYHYAIVETSPKIFGNYISHNKSEYGGGGGGIYCGDDTNPLIENNLILNHTESGLSTRRASVLLINNTICYNYNSGAGGAIFTGWSSNITILNSIFYNNDAGSYENRGDICLWNSCTLSIYNCFIDSNNCDLEDGSVFWSPNNIYGEPFFTDTMFNIENKSICTDAGVESVFVSYKDTTIYAPLIDYNGDIRPFGVNVEIGAQEVLYSLPFFQNCPIDSIIIFGDTLNVIVNIYNPHEEDIDYYFFGPSTAEYLGDSVIWWIPTVIDTGINDFILVACGDENCDTCSFKIRVTNGSYVCGEVSGVWTQENSPYLVSCNLTIPSYDSLVIRPGVEVIFLGDYYLLGEYVKFKAIGTEEDSIFFLSLDKSKKWGGIILTYPLAQSYSTSKCTLSYCSIINGGSYDLPISSYTIGHGAFVSVGYSAHPTIMNTIISYSLGYGVRFRNLSTINNKAIIENCDFHNNETGGIYLNGVDTCIVKKCNVSKNNYGIHITRTGHCILENNIIDNNYESGIYNTYGGSTTLVAKLFIKDNIITNNLNSGIDIYSQREIIIDSNLIAYNPDNGIKIQNCVDLNIFGNEIFNNGIGILTAPEYGDYIGYGIIENNKIFGNTCGAINSREENLKISRNLIKNNASQFNGAGVAVLNWGAGSEILEITGNIFENNNSNAKGGAIYSEVGSNIINNTFVNNSSSLSGGAIATNNSMYFIINNIFWQNESFIGPDVYAEKLGSDFSAYLIINNNNIDTNDLDILGNVEIEYYENINRDPLFSDSLFHIVFTSPCIDSGVESLHVHLADSGWHGPYYWQWEYDTVIFAPFYDYEGDTRPLNESWDIGADEFSPFIAFDMERDFWNIIAENRGDTIVMADTEAIAINNTGNVPIDLGLMCDTVPYFTLIDSIHDWELDSTHAYGGYGYYSLLGLFREEGYTPMPTPSDFTLLDFISHSLRYSTSDTFGPGGSNLSPLDDSTDVLWLRFDSPFYFPLDSMTIRLIIQARQHLE